MTMTECYQFKRSPAAKNDHHLPLISAGPINTLSLSLTNGGTTDLQVVSSLTLLAVGGATTPSLLVRSALVSFVKSQVTSFRFLVFTPVSENWPLTLNSKSLQTRWTFLVNVVSISSCRFHNLGCANRPPTQQGVDIPHSQLHLTVKH